MCISIFTITTSLIVSSAILACITQIRPHIVDEEGKEKPPHSILKNETIELSQISEYTDNHGILGVLDDEPGRMSKTSYVIIK